MPDRENDPLERITLIGGPGSGQTFELRGSCDLVKWVPKAPADFQECERQGYPIGQSSNMQPFYYRRSLRTPSKFVFQP